MRSAIMTIADPTTMERRRLLRGISYTFCFLSRTCLSGDWEHDFPAINLSLASKASAASVSGCEVFPKHGRSNPYPVFRRGSRLFSTMANDSPFKLVFLGDGPPNLLYGRTKFEIGCSSVAESLNRKHPPLGTRRFSRRPADDVWGLSVSNEVV